MSVSGFDLISGTAASNGALVIVKLTPWDERQSDDLHASAIVGRLYYATKDIPEALVHALQPAGPARHGLGLRVLVHAAGALEPAAGGARAVAQEFIAAAQQRPEIGRITTTFSASTPNYQLYVDREKAKKLGVPINDVLSTLQIFLGGYQVNDFTRFGRNYKVTMQADPEFRQEVSDIVAAVRAQPRRRHGAARHADHLAAGHRRALPAALQPVPHGRVQRLAGARARAPATRSAALERGGRARCCRRATASSGPARAGRRSRPATPR